MIFHPTQKIVAQDNHDYRIVCCGRQWGKTTLAIWEMIACAYAKSGRIIAYFATTYDQARNIAWTMLREAARQIIIKTNEQRLEITIKTQDGGESFISLRGFENIETARGQQFDMLVIDELAYMRNWDYAWQSILEPTLAFRKGKALFISSPAGFNHFYNLWELGQQSNSHYKSWKFTSYENPYLPKERIEKAKETNTENYFAQEYMADFRKYTGLVYKGFQREVHVIEPISIPESWQIYRGIDFGSTNPTACLWVAVDGDENWYIFDEHYATGETIDYHAGIINSKTKRSVMFTYGDPTGAQWISEFAQRGIYITPANKEVGTNFNSWVRFGIEKVMERLKTTPGHHVPGIPNEGLQGGNTKSGGFGLPRLFIFSICVNTIREFETYRWKEKSVTQAQDLNEPDVPEKANDHCFTDKTMILTKDGWKRIDSIKKGEYVWSPFGWNEVYRVGSTGKKKVKDYGIFCCTPDHKILTTNGLKEVDKLGYSDMIMVWANQKPWSLMEFLIGVIQMPREKMMRFILGAVLTKSLMARQDFYTETYGNIIKAKFLRAIWYIILTGTLGIMALAILSLSVLASMLNAIIGVYIRATKSTWLEYALLRKIGMLVKREGKSTDELVWLLGKTRGGFLKYVLSAIRGTRLPSLVEANIVIKTAKRQRFVVKKVYNLATRSGMYFANGVLVSNSMDALRYFAVSYEKPDKPYIIPKDDISNKNWELT